MAVIHRLPKNRERCLFNDAVSYYDYITLVVDERNMWIWSTDGMILTGENMSNPSKSWLTAILSIQLRPPEM